MHAMGQGHKRALCVCVWVCVCVCHCSRLFVTSEPPCCVVQLQVACACAGEGCGAPPEVWSLLALVGTHRRTG